MQLPDILDVLPDVLDDPVAVPADEGRAEIVFQGLLQDRGADCNTEHGPSRAEQIRDASSCGLEGVDKHQYTGGLTQMQIRRLPCLERTKPENQQSC